MESKKYKNDKGLNITFLYFMDSLKKIQKTPFTSFATSSLYANFAQLTFITEWRIYKLSEHKELCSLFLHSS
jgi:hypothetical protein